MQADYPAQFSRDQGGTEADWLRWLPGAVRGARWQCQGARAAVVQLPEGGTLTLAWQALEPRRIALISLPRLQVSYRFSPEVSAEARLAFMRYFDLYLQRGGG